MNRDNNFLLLRHLAALSVVLLHAYVVVGGSSGYPAWVSALGFAGFEIPVDLFFVISGFLVTGSLLSRPNLWQFLRARALRLYPAMWLSVLLVLLAVGLFFTDLAPLAFFTNSETRHYALSNCTLAVASYAYLPQAFAHTRFPGWTSPSLWSLTVEIRMYVLLAGLSWLVSRWNRRHLAPASLILALVLTTGAVIQRWAPFTDRLYLLALMRLGSVFFAGAAWFHYQNRIRWSWGLFAGLAASWTVVLVSKQAFFPIYLLSFPVMVLFLARVPKGPVRLANRLGDYSYGIYIYSFPIQQMLLHGLPRLGVVGMMALSVPLSVAMGMLSWYLVEKPAFLLKS